jgi:hypothetical protein
MPSSGRGVDLSQGEAIVLKPLDIVSGAVTNAVGTAVATQGERKVFEILLNITVSAQVAADTLDVFVDVLAADGTTWLNAIHFTQQAGNGAARKELGLLSPNGAPGAVTFDGTADAAAGVTRALMIGSQIRARWTQVNNTAVAHTFGVFAYAL